MCVCVGVCVCVCVCVCVFVCIQDCYRDLYRRPLGYCIYMEYNIVYNGCVCVFMCMFPGPLSSAPRRW